MPCGGKLQKPHKNAPERDWRRWGYKQSRPSGKSRLGAKERAERAFGGRAAKAGAENCDRLKRAKKRREESGAVFRYIPGKWRAEKVRKDAKKKRIA